jgi:hypothetical protein
VTRRTRRDRDVESPARRRLPPGQRPIFTGLDGILLLAAGFCIRSIADPRSGWVQISAAAIAIVVAVYRVVRATRRDRDAEG